MSDKKQRIDAAIGKYLHLIRNGQTPDLDEFVSHYPNLQVELRSAITKLESQTPDYQSKQGQADDSTIDGDQRVIYEEFSSSSKARNDDTAPDLSTLGEFDGVKKRKLAVGGPPKPFADMSAEQLPRSFGDYELLKKLAQGGMGVVYKARQTNLGRTVALKMILAGQLATDQHIQRFYREAKAAGSLDHPGIVPVYEVGAHDGQHFFSMGFVEGGDLNTHLRDGPLEQRVAATYTRDIAEAISYAHQQGIVHRDLKPGNVLVDSDGKLRLTDFGLATLADGKDAMTTEGQVLGTPSYMPPEQANGDIENVGPLSDIYSVGAVLYCLLTGRPPFQASNLMETLRQVVSADPVSPRTLNPNVSIDLETICLKCLEKEQKRRYESSAELAEDLGRFLDGKPINARPVGRLERSKKWIRRNKAVSAFAATAFIALLMGTIVSTVFGIQANQRAINESKAKDAFRIKEAEATRLSGEKSELVQQQAETITELEDNLYVSRLRQAQAALDSGDYETAQLLLEEDIPKSGQPDRRCFVWRYLYRTTQRADPNVFIRPSSEENARLARNESGSHVLVLSRTQFQVIDTQTMEVIFQKTGNEISDGCFVDDDRVAIAFGRGTSGFPYSTRYQHKGLQIFSIAAGVPDQTISLPEEVDVDDIRAKPGVCVAASSDGKKLAFGVTDGRVGLWSLDEHKLLGILKPSNHVSGAETKDTIRLAFEGNETLFSVRFGHALDVWNVATRSQVGSQFFTNPSRYMTKDFPFWLTDRSDIAVSSDGKVIAFSAAPGTLMVLRLARGEMKQLRTSSYAIASLEFVPGTHTLLSGSLDCTICMWDCDSMQQIGQLGSHAAAVGGATVLPSGRVLSFGADDRLRQWNIPETEMRESLEHGNRIYSMGFQPNSDRLITAGWQVGEQRYGSGFYDLSIGKYEPLDTRDRATRVHYTDITPDGNTVATLTHETNAIDIWNRQLQLSRTIRLKDFGFSHPATHLSLHPDGHLVASGSSNLTRVWNLRTGSVVSTISGVSRFSPDGRLLVSSEAKTVIRDVDGDRIGDPQDTSLPPITQIRFSSDSRLMAARLRDEPSEFVIIDVVHRKVLFRCSGHYQHVTDLAFCPNELTLASVGKDKRVLLWDAKTGRVKGEISGHITEINCAAFSPDGETLATGGNDAVVRFWHSQIETRIESRLAVKRLTKQDTSEASQTFARELSALGFDHSRELDFSQPSTLEAQVRDDLKVRNAQFTSDGLRMTTDSGHATWPTIEGAFPGDFELTATLDDLEFSEPGAHTALASLIFEFENAAKESMHIELKREPDESLIEAVVSRHWTPSDATAGKFDVDDIPIDTPREPQQLRLVRLGQVVHFLHRSISDKDFRLLGSRRIHEQPSDIGKIALAVKAYADAEPPRVVWQNLNIRWNGDAMAFSPAHIQKKRIERSKALMEELLDITGLPHSETIDLSDEKELQKRIGRSADTSAFEFTASGLGMKLEKGNSYVGLEIPIQLPGDFDVVATVNKLDLSSPPSDKVFARVDVGFDNDRKDVIGISYKRKNKETLSLVSCYQSGVTYEGSFFGGPDFAEVVSGSQVRLIRSGDKAHFFSRTGPSSPWEHFRTEALQPIGTATARIRLAIYSSDSQTVSVEWNKLEIRSAD